jgi:hypothetical protein
MANITINTQSANYQTRLTQLQEIKQFYGPRIVEYLKQPAERQEIWRTKDPILDELLDIADRIEQRTQA